MPLPADNPSNSASRSFGARLLRNLRPSHQHSIFSATLLLMGAVLLSRIIGYLREMYIAWSFGAGPQTDAYVAAFNLPDFLNLHSRRRNCFDYLHLHLHAPHRTWERRRSAESFQLDNHDYERGGRVRHDHS